MAGRRPITKAHLVTYDSEMRTLANSEDPHGQHYLQRRKRFSKNEIQFYFENGNISNFLSILSLIFNFPIISSLFQSPAVL